MNRANKFKILDRAIACLNRWPFLLVLAIWFIVFWPMNTGQSVVGFRDSAYLYYPYFKWIDQVWAAGELPLWNPYCDLGYPVVGDGTSSVFYPGKLLFFLRFLDYPVRYGWYLSLHVLLAAAGAYRLARRLGAEPLGATVAGFAYGFGGSVLFQVCNVVFLVSSAWLPFGLVAVWSMMKSSRPRHSIHAGTVAALMILGGDPQMAYLLAVIAAMTLAWNLIRRRYRLIYRKMFLQSAFRGATRLVLFSTVTMVLASIQILPTFFWVSQSHRMRQDLNLIGLTLVNHGGADVEAIYQFSQPPWSLLEMVSPNISGKPFPINQRWVEVLAGDDRFWTPSLYVGLLTFVLAIGGMRLWGRSKCRRWLTGLLLMFAFGSFGWFGAVWLYQEVCLEFGWPVSTEASWLGPYVGGPYWLATIVLPKFVMFRYPAKLFVVASLAMCVLAGVGFNRSSMRIQGGISAVLLSVSLLAFLLVPRLWPEYSSQYVSLLTGVSWQLPFGQLDWAGSQNVVRSALLHTVCVSACMLLIINCLSRPFRQAAMLGLLFADVVVANYWLVPQVDFSVFESETKVGSRLQELEWDPGLVPTIFGCHDWYKQVTHQSPERLAEVVSLQREFLHSKHHLEHGIRLLGSFTTIENDGRKLFQSFPAVVESEHPKPYRYSTFFLAHPDDPVDSTTMRGTHVEHHTVEILEFESRRMKIKVYNGAKAKLVQFLTPDPGWKVRIQDCRNGLRKEPELELGRNRVSVTLPVGEFELTYEYSPIEFWVGAWISLAGWIAWLYFVVRLMLQRQKIS